MKRYINSCCFRIALLCSPPPGDSATDARLDMGGWLALTRRGLSPRKKHRAFLGAITFKLTGAALFAASEWSAVLAVILPVPLGAVPAVKEASKDIVRQVRKLLEYG
jgi:hypothetical protein